MSRVTVIVYKSVRENFTAELEIFNEYISQIISELIFNTSFNLTC